MLHAGPIADSALVRHCCALHRPPPPLTTVAGVTAPNTPTRTDASTDARTRCNTHRAGAIVCNARTHACTHARTHTCTRARMHARHSMNSMPVACGTRLSAQAEDSAAPAVAAAKPHHGGVFQLGRRKLSGSVPQFLCCCGLPLAASIVMLAARCFPPACLLACLPARSLSSSLLATR